MITKRLTTTEQLRQIADMLMLNGTLTGCPGLVRGKMGISVFFFHYARYTNNKLFEEYAMELIGEIQNQIHVHSPADYERGIAGIGVGFDYLLRNHFLEADNDIFDDFDQRMFRAVMYDPWQDFSLYDGLTGYGRYWMNRWSSVKQAKDCLSQIISHIEEKSSIIPDKEQNDVVCFLQEISSMPDFDMCRELLKKCRKLYVNVSQYFPRFGNNIVGNLARIFYCNFNNDDPLDEINSVIKQLPYFNFEQPPCDMGLLSGYAGEGMLRLTALEPTNVSWINLL